MQIKTALNQAAQQLKKNNNASALLDAEILLAFVLKKNKVFLYSHPEKKLTNRQTDKYQILINKRAEGIPVAYLTGEKEFYGYKFLVNKNVLIPRPQTEVLVEQAVKTTVAQGLKNIADVGTGSGCIIISIANELKKKYNNLKKFKLYATDVSAKALTVARKNASFHGVSRLIEFYQGDLLTPVENKKIDLIVANLPYLGQKDLKKEKSIQFEPKKALVGNYYRKFLKQAGRYFNLTPIIIFEDKKGIHILIKRG